jgi:hypothetical protein
MSSAPLDGLLKNLRRLDYTRGRMERLYRTDQIALRDLHSVYEALFIRAVTSFEVFLQDQFLEILEGKARYTRARGISVRMTAVSSSAITDIMLQGRAYVTWLPYDETNKRALIYLNRSARYKSQSELR